MNSIFAQLLIVNTFYTKMNFGRKPTQNNFLYRTKNLSANPINYSVQDK